METNQEGAQTEKKPKTYKTLSAVLGMLLAVVLLFECGGCYINSASRWDTNNSAERSVGSFIDESIENAMVEKEYINDMKVDETRKHFMDSIGLYRRGKKWGFYNLNSETFISDGKEFDYAWFFAEGLAAVVHEGKIGFIDTKGQLVIPYQYLYRTNTNRSIEFQYGYCKMNGRDGRCGVIDKKGKWVIAPIYEGLSLTSACVYATTDTSRIRLDYQGKVLEKDMIVKVEPLKYKDEATGYYAYYVSEGGGCDRCGLMDSTGLKLTDPVYSKMEALGRKLFGCYLPDKITIEVRRF